MLLAVGHWLPAVVIQLARWILEEGQLLQEKLLHQIRQLRYVAVQDIGLVKVQDYYES